MSGIWSFITGIAKVFKVDVTLNLKHHGRIMMSLTDSDPLRQFDQSYEEIYAEYVNAQLSQPEPGEALLDWSNFSGMLKSKENMWTRAYPIAMKASIPT